MTSCAHDVATVFTACRKVDHSDPQLKTWLTKAMGQSTTQKGFLTARRKIEYWLVPEDLVHKGAHLVLAPGRNCGYCSPVWNDEYSILAVAPPVHPLVVKAQRAITAVALCGMRLADRIFKWGQKTCPQCFSKDLIRVSVQSEPSPHYCNGCNTIWPARG